LIYIFESGVGYRYTSPLDQTYIRMGIDALPCCKSCIINALRKPRGYPKKLNTIGDHIKAKRLDKGLYQKELAKMLGIGTDTLINWELGRNKPPSYQFKQISDFLGYCFYNHPATTLPLKLKYIRCYLFGMKSIAFAKHTGFDPSSIHNWENEKHIPLVRSMQKLSKICGFEISYNKKEILHPECN
jgi:transcriptional regulator with XRE-family HTH domain